MRRDGKLLYGVILTLPCVAMLLFPNRQVRRVEERMTAGDDRFFEEQRTYRSYPYLQNASAIRTLGAVGTICGVGYCLMQIFAK